MGLILNIPADYLSSNFIAHTPDEIAIIPKLSSPKLALELDESGPKNDRKKCILCGICQKVCPVAAIKVEKDA